MKDWVYCNKHGRVTDDFGCVCCKNESLQAEARELRDLLQSANEMRDEADSAAGAWLAENRKLRAAIVRLRAERQRAVESLERGDPENAVGYLDPDGSIAEATRASTGKGVYLFYGGAEARWLAERLNQAAELRTAIDGYIDAIREALTLLNDGNNDAAIRRLLRAATGKGMPTAPDGTPDSIDKVLTDYGYQMAPECIDRLNVLRASTGKEGPDGEMLWLSTTEGV